MILSKKDFIGITDEESKQVTINDLDQKIIITKTSGSTTTNHRVLPFGPAINVYYNPSMPSQRGVHLGKTGDGYGTRVGGSYGQLRSETYTFDFSSDVVQFDFILGGLNDNMDGIEKLKVIDVLYDSVSVLSGTKVSLVVESNDPKSDSIRFNQQTLEFEGVGFPGRNGWDESSLVSIVSSKKFNQIIFKRYDVENNRSDRNITGENYTNGVIITNLVSTIAEEEVLPKPIPIAKPIPTPLKVGDDLSKVLMIDPIHFEMDKSVIQPEAANTLDKIVEIMQKYPKMVIELGAHTDCRASGSYNQALSVKRAISSAKYIRERIDNSKRIFGKGYGESKLINDCDCGGEAKVKCSEAEHQENRRTEFVIVRM